MFSNEVNSVVKVLQKKYDVEVNGERIESKKHNNIYLGITENNTNVMFELFPYSDNFSENPGVGLYGFEIDLSDVQPNDKMFPIDMANLIMQQWKVLSKNIAGKLS